MKLTLPPFKAECASREGDTLDAYTIDSNTLLVRSTTTYDASNRSNVERRDAHTNLSTADVRRFRDYLNKILGTRAKSKRGRR